MLFGFLVFNFLLSCELFIYSYEVLGMTQSIGELGGLRLDLVACYAISWAIVVLCLIQGLKSMGKVCGLHVDLFTSF